MARQEGRWVGKRREEEGRGEQVIGIEGGRGNRYMGRQEGEAVRGQ